jgi:hypothetical protein
MRKLLDLSEDCVKTLSKRAIYENTDFKNLAQDILEREAKPFMVLKKPKSAVAKKKK